MKTNKCIIASVIVGSLGMANCLKADDSTTTTTTPAVTRDDDSINYPPLYRAQELDLDLFGAASIGHQTLEHLSGNRLRHHGLYGGGGGLTYFFCRYVGVGGEYDAETHHNFVDSAEGNVYLRVPILETGLAPYVFGGGGYQFEDVRQDFGQGGAGLEFRFTPHVGIFADGRYVFTDHTDNYAMVRAGVRIAF